MPELSSGFARLIHILAGYETSGTVTTSINPGFGDIDLDISLVFHENLELNPSHEEGVIIVPANKNVTMTVSPPEATLTFWFINGQVVSTVDTLVLDYQTYGGADLVWDLSVICFSIADGGLRAGQAVYSIEPDGVEVYDLTIWYENSFPGQTGLVGFSPTDQVTQLFEFKTPEASGPQVWVNTIPAGSYKILLYTDSNYYPCTIYEYWEEETSHGSATVIVLDQDIGPLDFGQIND